MSRVEALADRRSPEGFLLLVVMLWMRLCILPHFRDLLNCWNLWSEEKSTICTQASGMFQNMGPTGSYLSASTYELASLAFPKHHSEWGAMCGYRVLLLKALWHPIWIFFWFGFHLIEQISILASAYCRCWQSSVDYESQTKLYFPKHVFSWKNRCFKSCFWKWISFF